MINTPSDAQKYSRNKRANAFGSNHFSISFQVTGDCNFRCSYCYEHKRPEKMSLDAGIALVDKLFPIEDNIVWWNRYLRNSIEKNDIAFDFFGGECTLEIDTIEAICQHFIDKCNEHPEKYSERAKNLRILLETNGSLLRTPKVEAFLRKWERHLAIGLSLDGSKEFHDACRRFKDGRPTWQIVKDNLVWLLKNFPNVEITKIKSTITSETLPYIYDSYLLFKEIGLPVVDATIALGCEWKDGDEDIAREQYQKVLDDMLNDPHPIIYNAFESGTMYCNLDSLGNGKIGTCGSAGEGIALSADNKLYTCVQFSHITIYEEDREDMSIGTVESGITDRGIEIEDMILNSYDEYAFSNEKCKRCFMRPSCEYCPAFSYKATGNVNKMEKERCEIERIRNIYGMRYQFEMEKRRWQRKNLA